MKSVYAGLSLTAVLACASPSLAANAKERAFRLEITDNPTGERFDIRLVSLVNRRLCFEPYDWPNAPGQLSAPATLQFEGGSLPSKDANFGVPICPHIGCDQMVLPPHGTIAAFVSYSAFGATDQVKALPGRRLNFSIRSVKCRSKWEQ